MDAVLFGAETATFLHASNDVIINLRFSFHGVSKHPIQHYPHLHTKARSFSQPHWFPPADRWPFGGPPRHRRRHTHTYSRAAAPNAQAAFNKRGRRRNNK